MLLLLDFFREAPSSVVAFSLSPAFLVGGPLPIDLRVRRVAGSVASPCEAIFTPSSCALRLMRFGEKGPGTGRYDATGTSKTRDWAFLGLRCGCDGRGAPVYTVCRASLAKSPFT